MNVKEMRQNYELLAGLCLIEGALFIYTIWLIWETL